MKFSQVVALFLALFILLTLPVFLNTDVNAKAQISTTEYSQYLQSATEAGVSAASDYMFNGNLFASEEARNAAVEAYYNVLIKCFNYDYSTKMDMVKYYTPAIFLIDNDGYYIEYTETYQKDGFATYTDIITPINKWSASYGDYYIELHLDNSVKVIYDGEIYEGYYKDVYNKLGKPSSLVSGTTPELPDFSAPETDFSQTKSEYIINQLQDKIEYYINTHQEFFNQWGNVQYAFTLPKITGDDWGRLLDAPTIMGLLQGIQVPHSDQFINIYAFTGNEITEQQKYYILYDETYGLNYYHTGRHLTEMGLNPNDYQSYSMEGAAKQGAHPCPECVLKRKRYVHESNDNHN